MLRLIDKSKTHLIQKVTDLEGNLIRYQTVPIDEGGRPELNAHVIKEFLTLAASRKEAGL